MKNALSLISLPALIALTLGCAPAYHSYSGCYVDCRYCPPPPLQYTQYDECVCHSEAGALHLTVEPQLVEYEVEEQNIPDDGMEDEN